VLGCQAPRADARIPVELSPMSVPVPALSLVVPVFNEEGSLRLLHEEIRRHVGGMGTEWEVVYVDDHSTDGSHGILLALREEDPHVRVVRFSRNYGQTAAMEAGFELARGSVIVTIDADLQNDPADIPRIVAELHSGYDLVAGWRKSRKDGLLLRRLPSIAANKLISFVTGTTVHDTGCTLKAFRRELIEKMPIYAEQHRFLPVLSMASGARVSEMVVNHRPRRFGQSKYGIGRAKRVALDLLTVKMLSSFSRRPLYYFAGLSIPFAMLTVVVLVTGLFDHGNLAGGAGAAQPLLIFVLLATACVYFLMLGLLAELAVKASDVHDRTASGPLVSSSNG